MGERRHGVEQSEDAEALVDDFAERERRVTVGVLAHEIAHALSTPLLFLRDVVAHAPLDEGDRAAGREEIAKLERLMAALRRTRLSTGPSCEISAAALVGRALTRVSRIARKRLQVDVDVDRSRSLHADPHAAELLVVLLLRNAATAARERIGVVLETTPAEDVLAIEDDGPGWPERPPEARLGSLADLAPDGVGTGLQVAMYLARCHQWKVKTSRADARTRVSVLIPKLR